MLPHQNGVYMSSKIGGGCQKVGDGVALQLALGTKSVSVRVDVPLY